MARKMVDDTGNAFRYVQQLYDEVATLVREIEGTLMEQPESFLIGRPAGYSISGRSSTGLEQQNVNRWLTRRFAVFFVEEEITTTRAGQTITPIEDSTRVLYLRFLMDGFQNFKYGGEPITEPTLLFGVITHPRSPNSKRTKFEQLMGDIEYVEPKLMARLPEVDLRETYVGARGHLNRVGLFELKDPETLARLVIEPLLAQYRA